ncbi:MAG: hypothetical protein R3A52_18665 [Polyangiales bacterium]
MSTTRALSRHPKLPPRVVFAGALLSGLVLLAIFVSVVARAVVPA